MTRVSFIVKQVLLVISFAVLSACGNDMSRIDDNDLRKKVQECDYALNMSAAEHQICENYHRECKRRLRSEGRFVCN